jgi:hypothetical protein
MEYNTNPHRDDKPATHNLGMAQRQAPMAPPTMQQPVMTQRETYAKMSLFSLALAFGILLVYTLIASTVPTAIVPVIPLLSICVYLFSLVTMVMSVVKERRTRKCHIALFIHIMLLTLLITTLVRKTGE